MGVSTHDGHAKPSGFGKVNLGILDLGVFAGTFLFRWLTVDFANDHFVHLSRARQILLGDVPIRDFFDPGLFLQYYLSSAAQFVFGYNLFGEALLTISFVALGTMLVFDLSSRLSGSRWLAAGAALLTVLAYPRLHSYPKVILYVSAIGLVWLYARCGRRLHVTLMAALTAVAFLLRHDHGVYIAVMMVCFLGLREWGGAQLWRRLGLYTGVTVGLLLPFVVFVQTTAGLVRYVGGSEPQVRTIASFRSSFLSDPMAFKMDSSAPLWVVEPAPDRRVNVRWAEGVDDAVRQEREGRYGLTAGVRQEVEGWTWRYVLTDHEYATVRSLVEDRLVEDTAGIERGSSRLVPEPWDQWLERRLVVLRLRLLPGVLTPRNALAWFYYVTMLVPIVALGRVGADWWSERAARPEAAVVMAVAILCCIISHTLIRGFPDSQLPDVAAPTFVLAAWLAGRRSGPAGSPVRARLARAGIVSLFLVTFWSVGQFGAAGKLGSVGSLLVGSGVVGGPVGVWEQLGAVNRRLHLRPIDDWASQGSDLRTVTRYVLDCTAPSDRVLVTWFAPDLFYYAERGFAGGQVYLDPGWHASAADQRLTIERMQRQSVPIVLGRRDLVEKFRQEFPLVYDYVQARYRLAAELAFGEEQSYLIFVDGRRDPDAEHPDLGLPCFR